MADFLNAATATFDRLERIVTDAGGVCNNAIADCNKLTKVASEACDELARRIATLKKAGAEGDDVTDFEHDKEVKIALRAFQDACAANAKLAPRHETALARGTAASKELRRLQADCAKEIAARTRKKDRLLFAVDSKSLPKIVDLQKAIAKLLKQAEVEIEATDGQLVGNKRLEDKLRGVSSAIGRVKASDAIEMRKQAFDKRVFSRQKAQAMIACRETVSACAAATAAAADGKAADARITLKRAAASFETARGILNRYLDYRRQVDASEASFIDGFARMVTEIGEIRTAATSAGKQLVAAQGAVAAAKGPA